MPISRTKAFLALSAIAFAKHLWFLATWIVASNRGGTQAESVEIFLGMFPHSLFGLGARSLTLVLIGVGIIGALFASQARKTQDAWRPAATGLLIAHSVFVLWYLFTLM